MEDEDSLLLKMIQETVGIGTRRAGKQVKTKVINLIESKPGYPIYLDWSGIPVISSSFADEFIGKLFVEIGSMASHSLIRNISMEPVVKSLIDKAISQRLTQQKKPP